MSYVFSSLRTSSGTEGLLHVGSVYTICEPDCQHHSQLTTTLMSKNTAKFTKKDGTSIILPSETSRKQYEGAHSNLMLWLCIWKECEGILIFISCSLP